jgi:hypothetical protein
LLSVARTLIRWIRVLCQCLERACYSPKPFLQRQRFNSEAMTTTTPTKLPSYCSGGTEHIAATSAPRELPFHAGFIVYGRLCQKYHELHPRRKCFSVSCSRTITSKGAEIRSTTVSIHGLSATNEQFATGLIHLLLSNQGTLIQSQPMEKRPLKLYGTK